MTISVRQSNQGVHNLDVLGQNKCIQWPEEKPHPSTACSNSGFDCRNSTLCNCFFLRKCVSTCACTQNAPWSGARGIDTTFVHGTCLGQHAQVSEGLMTRLCTAAAHLKWSHVIERFRGHLIGLIGSSRWWWNVVSPRTHWSRRPRCQWSCKTAGQREIKIMRLCAHTACWRKASTHTHYDAGTHTHCNVGMKASTHTRCDAEIKASKHIHCDVETHTHWNFEIKTRRHQHREEQMKAGTFILITKFTGKWQANCPEKKVKIEKGDLWNQKVQWLARLLT